MAIKVAVKKTEPRTVAFLAKKGPYSQLSNAFSELYGLLQEKGYKPAGPPCGVFFNSPQQVPEQELLWELQWPVSGKVAPAGPDKRGFGVKNLPATEVACTMHKGPFDQVGAVYGALFGWIMQNGYEVAGPSEEVYLSDPASTPAAELQTEIRFPVRKK